MGYYTRIFIKPKTTPLAQPWAGSLVMDRQGKILTSTISSSLPNEVRQLVVDTVLAILVDSERNDYKLKSLVITYDRLKLVVELSVTSIYLYFISKRYQPPDSELSSMQLPPAQE